MKSLFTAVATTALFVGGAGLAHAEHHMEKSEKMDIVDTAASNDAFSTLVTAVTEADLVEALKGDGPFTVFAPTNEAFAALPEGTLDTLLMEENQDQLQGILKLHVVSGKIMAGDIAEGSTEVETLAGDTITVTKDSHGAVTVGDADVVTADVKASNGVIHVIDSVILPE
ncbi:fasciclin domain-containing protein [Henriciella sp. AS95]|uniref:fasciclin domain-containing protein n=1 Tax=Henriciella sp. AS95 TaxID=3135782 RepID=UPI0031751DF1